MKILLNVEITPNCPARCAMCPRELVRDSGFMTQDIARRIAAQVTPDMAWELDFAGRGEPTIHPEMFDLAATFRDVGVPLGIVTTGVQMTARNAPAMADAFDIIRLSVSSVDRAVFEKVHIGLKFDSIWRNIAALAPLAADKSVIHLTGGPVIYETLPETVAYLRSLGFQKFRLLSLWNRGGYFESIEDRDRRHNLIDSLGLGVSEDEAWTGIGRAAFEMELKENLSDNPRFCPIGFSSLSISWNGRILGCFQDFGHSSIFGNIKNVDLKSHLAKRNRDLGNMAVCRKCDAHKVTLFSKTLE